MSIRFRGRPLANDERTGGLPPPLWEGSRRPLYEHVLDPDEDFSRSHAPGEYAGNTENTDSYSSIWKNDILTYMEIIM